MFKIGDWTIAVPANGRFGIYRSDDGIHALVKMDKRDLVLIVLNGNNVTIHASEASVAIEHETKTLLINHTTSM